MKRSAFWELMPLYLWTIALVALPTLYILVLSFLTQGEGYDTLWIFTLDNYRRLLDPVNVQIFLKSLRVAAMTTVLSLAMGYAFAYCMAGRPKRIRQLLLMLVIVPFWTSALLRVYGWMVILRANGLLNALLGFFGLDPVKTLYTPGAIVFGMVYSFLPFMILPIYTTLEKLDGSFREAARDLGAGPIKSFLTVTLPLTLPGVVSGCVLVFVPSMGMFFISDLMGGGADMLLGNLVSHYFQAGRNWPMGAALSIMLVGMTFITLALYRKFSGGEELGVF